MAINSKKGIIFSLIAILMSTLFILIFSAYVHVPLDQKSEINRIDVERAENFLGMFPEYFGTAIEQSSYEILPYLINISPLTNFSSSFKNCTLTGKINSSSFEYCSPNAENATLNYLVGVISTLASDIYRGTCEVKIIDLDVTQIAPYKLTIDAEAEIFFEKSQVTFNRRFAVTQQVNLVGFVNPLTKDVDGRIIKYQNNEYFSKKEFNGNISLIKEHIDKGYSFLDVSAPSFIDVLEGNIQDGTFNASKKLGLNSFIPSALPNGTLTYKEDRSFLSWDYVRDVYINKTNLRLIKDQGLAQRNLTFSFDDLIGDFNLSSSQVYYAVGEPCNCNANGCTC